MKNNRLKSKKLFLCFVAAFFLALFSFGIYSLTSRLSLAESDGWDGVTVATEFARGNGTVDNPYIIDNAPEFIYFKQILEGDSYDTYSDKYYQLGNDIDLGGNTITPIGVSIDGVERIFQGSFNGDGHIITNFKISEPSIIGEVAYYSLFSKTLNASFNSLGISEYEIKVGDIENRVVASLLVGSSQVSEDGSSSFNNIFMNHFFFDASSLKEGSNAYLLIGEKDDRVSISNISLNGDIQGNGLIGDISIASTYTNISNIIDQVRVIDALVDHINYGENSTIYHVNEDTSIESIVEGFNTTISDNHYWAYENNEIILKKYEEVIMDVPETSKSFTFSIQKAPNFSLHASGIDGNTVYINNLDSDYNYYMGLNYTTSSNGDTPTMEDKGIYTNSNLKKFQIIYHGDFDASRIGTISYASGENQNTVVYYKYYYVSGNSVDIELIDNPFSGRPDDMAFNGWFSKDSNISLYLDTTYYVWHAVVPVSGDNVVVELYASWVEALVSDTNSNYRSINYALENLYDEGMHLVDLTETRTRPSNYIDNDRYYYVRVILENGDSQSGYYNANGYYLAGYCNNATCTVYRRIAAGSTYDPDETYYYSQGGQMRETDPRGTEQYQAIKTIYENMTMANYYEQKTLSRNQSQEGYVNYYGANLSGTCSSYSCTVYQRIPYAGESLVDVNKTYYYLVTRDTQFVYLNSYSTTGRNNYWTVEKPFTLTSWYYRATDARETAYFAMTASYMRAVADTRVEYVRMNSYSNGNIDNDSLSSSSNSTGYIYGNRKNFKLGRGITRNGSNRSAIAVTGGANDGRSASNFKYKLIVESGFYGYITPIGLRASATYTNPDVIAVYGNDYDRIRGNHTNLDILRTIYGSNLPTVTCDPVGDVGLRHYILSGTIGSLTNTTNTTIGIYLTSNSSNKYTCAAQLTVEGGIVNNIYGGPGPRSSTESSNIVQIFFKGGTVDAIFGGGAYLTSYSNRIVQVTGGLVNYAVTAGSNGYASDGSDTQLGTLTGDTYVYVGGTAEIGNPTFVNAEPIGTKFDMEAGSVFGSANGKEGYPKVGSSENAYVVINGGVIHGDVYGGANYGAVAVSESNGTYQSKVKIVSGTIEKSVYSGGNNNGAGANGVTVNTSIEMLGGTVNGSVYGGSKTKGTIYGPASVTISGGTVKTDVYGGGEGGYTNNNNPGTYVRDSVAVTINNGSINGNVYGGSAYGTVNAVNQNTNNSSSTTTVTVNNGTVSGNVFGGAKGSEDYTPKVVGNITVNINGGNIGKVFGGMDAAGQPSNGDVVYLNGGTIGDAFGGGNNTGQSTTNIYLQGANITGNLYGGSNLLGSVTTSNVTVSSGSVKDIYGGNNLAGSTATTHVTATGGTINGDIYGGGNEAPSTTSYVTTNGVTCHDIYGGCKKANLTTSHVDITSTTGGKVFGGSNITGTVGTSHVDVKSSSQFDSVYGGNNQGGQTNNTNVDITASTIGDVYGGGDNASSTTSHVTINSGVITNVYGGGNEAGLTTANVIVKDGTITNVFGGSNAKGDITTANITVGDNSSSNIHIGTLYGGNNLGGVTTTANITGTKGTIDTIYGGGNEASVGTTVLHLTNTQSTDIYGGGNAAGISGSTLLDLNNVVVDNNIYGGGNEGIVEGSTVVTVTDSHIKGNAFAGGNGSTAIVYQNSSITIDGDSEIGTDASVAPKDGCVFGSGNAASTGLESVHNSQAVVNIVGGKIHGNVYGGPKMAVVYGTTDTNIGTVAVNQSGLTESDIIISGTVFGGGESNASGSESYDWSFISVTDGIDVNIDGTGYEGHNHEFIINGSIFGSGNASSSSGTSIIFIKNLGTISKPNVSVSIQRANLVTINNSVIELLGAKDRTNDYADILYSFNIIDKLIIKNNTTLLLQHNANLLKELYSGVDSGGSLVPATVTINENTHATTKNVDNRIYMIPGQNLNVTINQAGSAYGEITGMTFFGMYEAYDNGTYRFGLYDRSYSHGDSGNASLAIPGGSYVVGLRKTNHNIKKDGFYTNTIDEDTHNTIFTDYIDPTRIGDTGYRWVVGFEAISYEFTLIASRYSSLGTYELPMIHFADGNTRFTVLGFAPNGLSPGISLVDSNLVPRVGEDENEANSILGLSMKAETQEWTGYGTTKMLSQEVSDGKYYTGTEEYLTDNRSIAPSMMFYLYHAKNITSQGSLGTVVVTMQAAIPKNQIDYDIKYITITIHLNAVNADADSYDASITYDKKYEMPSSTSVNITNTSQFSAYYSLTTFKDDITKVYGNDLDYFHVLVTNNPLPVNTMITMIDYSANSTRPEYYYFRVTQSVYNDSVTQLNTYNEVTYRLSNFIKMDSTSTTNTYNDAENNLLYYDSTNHLVDEEFMFIFDFKECNVTGNHLDNTMLFELRNQEDRTMFSVYGLREALMFYSTYESSNAVLSQTFEDVDSYLYYNVPDEIDYSTEILYDETDNRQSVIDTNYESRGMGLNVVFIDRDGEVVSSSLLLGTSISIGNQQYFADGDGVFRIKLSNKVSNLHKVMKVTPNTDLPAGQYTIRYTLFASDDGLHNSDAANSVSQDFVVQVVSAENSITVDCEDEVKVVNGETGTNMLGTRINTYHVKYASELTNPNFRVEVFKRGIVTADATDYTSVPFSQLFTNSLSTVSGNEVSISMDDLDEKDFEFQLQTSLTSGTYRIVFKLYDSNQLIDEEVKYVIVNKKVE